MRFNRSLKSFLVASRFASQSHGFFGSSIAAGELPPAVKDMADQLQQLIEKHVFLPAKKCFGQELAYDSTGV